MAASSSSSSSSSRMCRHSWSRASMSPPPDDVARSAVEGARSVLASWTVSAYLAHRRASSRHPHACAVSVDPGDALGDILRVLAKHRVLSAPVIERQGGRFHGFVDVAEILGAFVASCRRWLERPGTGYGTVRLRDATAHRGAHKTLRPERAPPLDRQTPRPIAGFKNRDARSAVSVEVQRCYPFRARAFPRLTVRPALPLRHQARSS